MRTLVEFGQNQLRDTFVKPPNSMVKTFCKKVYDIGRVGTIFMYGIYRHLYHADENLRL